MGFLHVASVFSADEMREANREIDRLAARARPGDDESWWVSAEDGARVLCRLVYATLRSPVLAALESDPALINTDPYGKGWIFILEPDAADTGAELMDSAAYQEFLAHAAH